MRFAGEFVWSFAVGVVVTPKERCVYVFLPFCRLFVDWRGRR